MRPEDFAALYERLKGMCSQLRAHRDDAEDSEALPSVREVARMHQSQRTYPAWSYPLGFGKFPLSEREDIWRLARNGAYLPGLRERREGVDPAARALARARGLENGALVPVMHLTWSASGMRASRHYRAPVGGA